MTTNPILINDERALRLLLLEEVREMPTEELQPARERMVDRPQDRDFQVLAPRILKQLGGRPTSDRVANLVNIVRDILAEEIIRREEGGLRVPVEVTYDVSWMGNAERYGQRYK